MRKLYTVLFAASVLLLCLLPASAIAWGREGHRIIAQIAMRYVTPVTKARVLEALGGTSPEEAAIWMDNMRSNPAYDYMKTWHYLDVKQGKYYKDGGVDHLIAALNHSYNDLMKKRVKAAERREALMILFHLVGDLHQPLHVGFPDDEGGNETYVLLNGRTIDLHRLWDTEIISVNKITAEDILMKTKIPATPGIVNHYRQGDFVSWMNDGRGMLPGIYDIRKQTIDKEYLNRNKPAAQLLLFAAGIRLAFILELVTGNVADADKFKFGKGTEFVSSGRLQRVP
jgi:hypothetical protein